MSVERCNWWIGAAFVGLLLGLAQARGDHRIGDVCRIKGQEENYLHGMGLVVGLKGTGDGDNKQTQAALAQYMGLHGHRVRNNQTGQPMLEDLKNAKNVALVFISATIPPGGAQQGDRLDCTLSAFGAKSLAGGTLMLTSLRGPLPTDKTVYALAMGPISLDDPQMPQSGRIPLGCQLERSIENEFVHEGKLTLVMNKDHAAFRTTHDVEAEINSQRDFISTNTGQGIARAIDQVTIEVTIPQSYRESPALFASLLLDTRLVPPQNNTRVIINERKQQLAIGADVEIGPVAVMHKSRLIRVGPEAVNQAVSFDIKQDPEKPKLTALVDALNDLKVPTADVIDIIKMLKHKRALFGELIIE